MDMSIGQRLGSLTQPAVPADAGGGRQTDSDVIHPRVQAVMVAARFHGTELDPGEVVSRSAQGMPSAASLSEWAQNGGMWARAVRLRWRQLMHFVDAGPVVLLLADGSATLMVGADADRNVVFLRDPHALASQIALAVDELRLERAWSGEALLLRAQRGKMEADAPFTLGWVSGLVLQEKSSLRDIGLGSLTLSFLTIFPPLLVMTVVDKVLAHRSYSTLALLGTILAITTLYETVLGYARRLIVMVVGARLDAKLNLHVFNRLLRLPLDYFERHPAGETMHKIAQVYKVREFLTGKLLTTFLDMITLAVLLPFLFYLNSFLAFLVLACSTLIVVVVLTYLRPLQRAFAKVVVAEAEKAAALGETVFGIKTVKSLALEPQR
jgi:subfamily B ATP-binding cassette protein HlyB/CyaB